MNRPARTTGFAEATPQPCANLLEVIVDDVLQHFLTAAAGQRALPEAEGVLLQFSKRSFAGLDFPDGIVAWSTVSNLAASVAADIYKRPFITIGFTAFRNGLAL